MVQRVSDLPDPKLPFRPHGWFRWHVDFERMLLERKPKICLEIGAWTGLSVIYTARIVSGWGGIVIAVDPWNGFIPVSGDAICEEIAPVCYEQFLSNVYYAGVHKNVAVIRGTSSDLSPEVYADWIYLDGSHDFLETRKDLETLWPKLNYGGIILGDDFGMEGVQYAWLTFFNEKVETNGDQLVWKVKPSES